jgi:hypothetical protein
MPRRRLNPKNLPKHGLHASSRCGRVRWNGQERWTGPWRSKRGKKGTPPSYENWEPTPEAEAKYRQLCSELLAHGTFLSPKPRSSGNDDPDRGPRMSVAELVDKYTEFCETIRYADRLESMARVSSALRVLLELKATTDISDFEVRDLIEVRDAMIRGRKAEGDKPARRKWSRVTCNHAIHEIRRCFRWAVQRGLIPQSSLTCFHVLDPLKRSESCGAAEPREVLPAEPVDVLRLIQVLPKPLAAMVELQALTGMRPGEICMMRAVDIETGVLVEVEGKVREFASRPMRV